MSIFPPPHLSGSDSEKLSRLYSYLCRLAEQLNNTDFSAVAAQSTPTQGVAVPSSPKLSAIKSMIIQSADVINAYCDAMEKRLTGRYVAESEFGVYREQTAAALRADAKELSVLFENTEQIESLLKEVESSISKIHARLRAGLLYTDEKGQPVYGLEIGQQSSLQGEEVFRKFARFTADRLSFYDKNDTEVAYVSDYKLYITCVCVKSSLWVGGYLMQAEDGLVFRWNG